jgi:hypothetical protein
MNNNNILRNAVLKLEGAIYIKSIFMGYKLPIFCSSIFIVLYLFNLGNFLFCISDLYIRPRVSVCPKLKDIQQALH